MESDVTKSIKECNELIQTYYNPHYVMRLESLYEKLEIIWNLIKTKYPCYYEELGNSIFAFKRNQHSHNMGCISTTLSIIEKNEHDCVEYVNKEKIAELLSVPHSRFDLTVLSYSS